MDRRGKRFFDAVCPALPVLREMNQDICAELAANLTNQTVGTSTFSAEKIASMIVGSQHLRRIALKHSDDINSILNGYGAKVMASAKKEFLTEMARASDSANNALRCHDSYSFLATQNSLVKTGATGTNLGDLILIVWST